MIRQPTQTLKGGLSGFWVAREVLQGTALIDVTVPAVLPGRSCGNWADPDDVVVPVCACIVAVQMELGLGPLSSRELQW